MWRLWKHKVHVDDTVRRWGMESPSKCWCCNNVDQETLSHVFLKSFIARTLSYFCSFASLNMQGLPLRDVIMLWLNKKVRKDIRPYFKAIPSFIIWELWQRRNKQKHDGKKISLTKVIYRVTRNVMLMIKIRRPAFQLANNWQDILQRLEDYSPRLWVRRIF